MSEEDLGLTRRQALAKRAFDLVGSILGLALTGWIIAIAFVLATFDTRQPGFFTQERVGRAGRRFRVIKIRTMRPVEGYQTNVTASTDPRITRLGGWLRRTHVDELPQLINVLKGDMSFVGPRPDVPGFADRLKGVDRMVLSVRPGITGPATLKYRQEERLLAEQSDPEGYNREVMFPDKTQLNRKYVEEYTFSRDLAYIWQTVSGKGGGNA